MKNRKMILRIRAFLGKEVAPEKAVVKNKRIIAMDPDSKTEVFSWDCIEDAIMHGYAKANISKAVKTGTKYKGYLWGYTE